MAEFAFEAVSSNLQKQFNRGFSLFERGNWDGAIAVFEACLQSERGFVKARKFLRASQIQRAKARGASKVGAAFLIARCMPLFLKAKKALHDEQYDLAMDVGERLLDDAPLNLDYLGIFHTAARGAGYPESAVETLIVARDAIQPRSALLTKWVAQTFVQLGRSKEAIQYFEEAAALDPRDADVQQGLKNAIAQNSMEKDGWAQNAAQGGTYQTLLKSAKLTGLIRSGQTQNLSDITIEEQKGILEEDPDNLNHYKNLARTYQKNRMYAEAVNIVEQALARKSDDAELGTLLSQVKRKFFDQELQALREQGDESAILQKEQERLEFLFEDLQLRIAQYPHDLNLRFEWGRLLHEHGYDTEAIEQLQLAQKNPQHRILSLYLLGLCFCNRGHMDVGLSQLQLAASELPTMDEVKKAVTYDLASVLENLGRLDEAAQQFKQIYLVDIRFRDIEERVSRLYKAVNPSSGSMGVGGGGAG
jgi:tetratricopeptide (TPR) repeat protein